jgi:MoaA/NifB/PqqE/SkfB family radical SAM enzyme
MNNYLLNLIDIARGRRVLRPLVAIFHLTGRCNLNCAYCEDYGARRTNDDLAELGVLSLDEADRVLAVLRQATAALILTGGEPLLYPHLAPLLDRAKVDYSFQHLTLLTNGLLLAKHLYLLPQLDRVVVSLDSLDRVRWGQVIGLDSRAAGAIVDTITSAARRQAVDKFELIVNCVVTPETLPDAPAVLDFCVEHGITFAFSPQSFNNWPRYELLITADYRVLVEKVISYKKQGQKILGSLAYLSLARDFQPYHCYPTLVPRVLPNGDLIYPCRPIERGGTAHGGRPCNLVRIRSWQEAVNLAVDQFDSPPKSCSSCFQQCYAEPSLMQAQPMSLLREMLAFKVSRRLKIHTFAPG